ncbi:hypothetical protein U9M48_009090, partial [Paspalum notatum var. saurae]
GLATPCPRRSQPPESSRRSISRGRRARQIRPSPAPPQLLHCASRLPRAPRPLHHRALRSGPPISPPSPSPSSRPDPRDGRPPPLPNTRARDPHPRTHPAAATRLRHLPARPAHPSHHPPTRAPPPLGPRAATTVTAHSRLRCRAPTLIPHPHASVAPPCPRRSQPSLLALPLTHASARTMLMPPCPPLPWRRWMKRGFRDPSLGSTCGRD